MFNSKENKQKPKGPEAIGPDLNLIGAGTSINGDITSTGDLRIDGQIIGNVVAKAKLVLGPTGKIEGDIESVQADIQGNIKGKITVSDVLFLKATANIDGDIKTVKLVVESGASFNGLCSMGSARINDYKTINTES